MDLDSESAKKLIARIGDTFEALPVELKKAAEYVMSNPNEVAFRSMRSIALAAKVSPSTMVRLARALKLDGFDDLRAAFQVQLEARNPPFTARARKLRASSARSHWLDRVHALIDEEVASIHAYVHDLDDRKLEKVGAMLTVARRVYVVGLRGMYPAAFFFHYSAAMFSEKTVLVDGGGGTVVDAIRGSWLMQHDLRLWKRKDVVNHQRMVDVIFSSPEKVAVSEIRNHILGGLESELVELRKSLQKGAKA